MRTPRVADDRGWDVEVVALCDAMNTVPGIRTFESCSGHGEDDFRVWFKAADLEALPRLLYWFDGCHCGFYHWKVVATTDCGMSPVSFCVVGPVGAFDEANEIARLIREEGEREWQEAQREREQTEERANPLVNVPTDELVSRAALDPWGTAEGSELRRRRLAET